MDGSIGPITRHDIENRASHPHLDDGNLTVYFESDTTHQAYLATPLNHPYPMLPDKSAAEDDRGVIVLTVDVPKRRTNEIAQLIRRRHPEAEANGVGWTIPVLGLQIVIDVKPGSARNSRLTGSNGNGLGFVHRPLIPRATV